MRLYTLLFVTVFVVGTRAASIPTKLVPNIEKRVNTVVDDVEKAIEKISKQPDGLQVQLDDVKLKTNEVKDIPVKVIADEPKPTPETDKEHNVNYVPADDEVTPDIKRVEIDLKHPGEPQRQEHDSQSPEPHKPEEAAVAMIKQNVIDAQNTFKQGFQGVTQNIQNWIADNEQLQSIQENIQNLQDSFNNQIQRLNTTVQGFFRPQSQEDNDDVFKDRQETKNNVVKTINGIGETFKSGMEGISYGVEMLAAVKEVSSLDDGPQFKQTANEVSTGSTDNEAGSAGGATGTTISPASGTTVQPTGPFGGVGQFFTNFQATIMHGFGNVSSLIQNYVNQNGNSETSPGSQGQQTNGQNNPAGTQSEEGTTQRPTIWQGIQSQFANIFSPQSPGTNDPPGNGPFAQVISNNPIVQNLNNFFRPTEKPAEGQPAQPAEGSNVVPETPAAQSDAQSAKPAQPAPQPAQAPGPIQAAIQRNPIIQGLAGAVQRIQSTVTNPEKPREVEKDSTRKHGGYGSVNNNAATGDSNSDGINEEKDKPEPKPEETEEIPKLCDKTDGKESKPIDKKD